MSHHSITFLFVLMPFGFLNLRACISVVALITLVVFIEVGIFSRVMVVAAAGVSVSIWLHSRVRCKTSAAEHIAKVS